MEGPTDTTAKTAKTGRKRNGVFVDGSKIKELEDI